MAKSYPNPYDFVPLEGEVAQNAGWRSSRRAWDATREGLGAWQVDRFTGRLHCVLTPETPLFIHGEGQQRETRRQFFRRNDQLVIPATSLKGIIRSLFEIVSDGCLSALSDKYQVPFSHSRTYPQLSKSDFNQLHPIITPENRLPHNTYLPCPNSDDACPACLLFGMVDTTKSNKRDSKNSDQVKPKLLAGRLLFSDGVCETPRVRWVQIPGAGGGPHPWHTRFYFHQDGRGHILGRKLYFHHQSYEATLALYRQNERLKFIDVGGQLGRFTFTLDFVQLSQEELDLLVYALALEPGMRHHIGYGKPYGLGSVAISVQHIEWRYGPHNDGQSRYLTFDHQVARNSDLQPRVDAGKTIWLERLRGAGAMQVYNDFARILAWPGVDHYQYPDFGWFRNTAGSSAVTLAEYQAGVRTKSVATQSHTSSSGRLSGRVKWFNAEKNFGFIAIDGRNRDLFVHINEIAGRQPLREGQRVELEEGPSRRPGQTEAKNVTIVKG